MSDWQQSQFVYKLGLSWGGDGYKKMEFAPKFELKSRGFGDCWEFSRQIPGLKSLGIVVNVKELEGISPFDHLQKVSQIVYPN